MANGTRLLTRFGTKRLIEHYLDEICATQGYHDDITLVPPRR